MQLTKKRNSVLFMVVLATIMVFPCFFADKTHAVTLYETINYNEIAKKTQAQALYNCLSQHAWSGNIDNYSGSIFDSTGSSAYLFVQPGSSGYNFNRLVSTCNTLFSSSMGSSLAIKAVESPSKKLSKEELKVELEKIGYSERSTDNFTLDKNKALQYYTGYSNYSATQFSGDDGTLSLIAFYINSNAPVGYGGYEYYNNSEAEACYVSGDHAASAGAHTAVASGDYVWLHVSTIKRCAVKQKQSVGGINVFTIRNHVYDGSEPAATNFSQLIGQWNTIMKYEWKDPEGQEGENLIDSDTRDPVTGNVIATDENGKEISKENVCKDTVGVLGWFMCPVTDWMGRAAVTLYNGVIEPFLEVDAGKMLQSGGDLYVGWSTFRNLANIVFVILFIVVIIAQITGVGISNYNIKRILPRLIVIVVLVNVSFIICQLAVDISNILGNGLKATFTSLAEGVGGKGSVSAAYPADMGFNDGNSQPFSFSVLVANGLAILGHVGLGTAVVAGALTIKLWLPMFIVSLLGALISLFFFFVVLGARQVGIVILIVLAPIAIVCYSLPNTKSLFDRWRKLFMAMLLVYPICGLLIGGGQYVSALLVNSGNENFFFQLCAMLVSVMPFFMIPSLVKGSMAMAGNLGMKISNFGRGMRGASERAMRSSQVFKNGQEDLQRSYLQKRNRRISNKLTKRIGKLRDGETLSASQMRRLGRAESALNADVAEQRKSYDAIYQNRGTAQNADAMNTELLTAANAMRADPNDLQARGRFMAAMNNLSVSDKGRQKIENMLLDQRMAAANLKGDEKKRALDNLRWMRNAVLDANGKEIKNVAPSLFNEITRTDDLDAKTADKSMLLGGIDVGSVKRDEQGNITEVKRTFTNNDYDKMLENMSAERLINLDAREQQQLVKALSDSSVDPRYKNKIASLADRALTNPQIRDKIKDTDEKRIRKMANHHFTDATTTPDDHTEAISGASLNTIKSIGDGLRQGTIADGDTDGGVNYGNERTNIITTMHDALRAAASSDSQVELVPENAAEMLKIIRQHGSQEIQSEFYDNQGQLRDRYQMLTSMKVDHQRSDRQQSQQPQPTPSRPVPSQLPIIQSGQSSIIDASQLSPEELRAVQNPGASVDEVRRTMGNPRNRGGTNPPRP